VALSLSNFLVPLSDQITALESQIQQQRKKLEESEHQLSSLKKAQMELEVNRELFKTLSPDVILSFMADCMKS